MAIKVFGPVPVAMPVAGERSIVETRKNCLEALCGRIFRACGEACRSIAECRCCRKPEKEASVKGELEMLKSEKGADFPPVTTRSVEAGASFVASSKLESIVIESLQGSSASPLSIVTSSSSDTSLRSSMSDRASPPSITAQETSSPIDVGAVAPTLSSSSSSSSSPPSKMTMPAKVTEAFRKIIAPASGASRTTLSLEEANSVYKAFKFAKPVKAPTLLDTRTSTIARMVIMGAGGTGYACLNNVEKGDRPINSGYFKNVYHCIGLHDGESYAVAESDVNKSAEGEVFSDQAPVTKDLARALLQREKTFAEWLGKSPGIIHTPSVLETLDKFYFVMDLCEGGDLFDFLQAMRKDRWAGRTPLPVEKRLDLGRQLLVALQKLHHHRIIHRDLKPENILLDREGRAVLTDFGGATVDDDTSALGVYRLCGTPGFMAPEVVGNKRATIKSDMWAFGMILYTLATLEELPWAIPQAADAPAQVTPFNDPSWRLRFPGTPMLPNNPRENKALKALITDLIQVEPGRRISSIEAFSRLDDIIKLIETPAERPDGKEEA